MKKKIAVYTAITGNYDELIEDFPTSLLKQADFYCFTDNPQLKSDIYQVIPIQRKFRDKTRDARFIKVNPPDIIYQYDIFIWIDGNIRILTQDLAGLADNVLHYHDIAIFKHLKRDCVYEEAKYCIRIKKDQPWIILLQMLKYKLKGFPKYFGLVETPVIIRRNTVKVNEFNRLWWKEINKGSKRDQLSFDYIRWFTGISLYLMEGSIYNTPFFIKEKHLHKKMVISPVPEPDYNSIGFKYRFWRDVMIKKLARFLL